MFIVSLQQIYKSKCGNYYIGIISGLSRGFFFRKSNIEYRKSQKNLHICKKSSTFAPEIDKYALNSCKTIFFINQLKSI